MSATRFSIHSRQYLHMQDAVKGVASDANARIVTSTGYHEALQLIHIGVSQGSDLN